MKKLIALLLAMVMMLALVACNAPQETDGDVAGGNTHKMGAWITVVVVHSDGTEKSFSYETNEKYLGPMLQEEGLIKGNDGPYGLEITEVDGEQAIYDTDKAYWALYEGEEYALQGIDTTPVVDGRIYKLVYTGA